MIHQSQTLTNYFQNVTASIRRFGRVSIEPWQFANYKTMTFLFGFKTPDGNIYAVSVQTLKSHYQSKEWHESTLVLPSGARVAGMTRIPPNIVELFSADLKKAQSAGEDQVIEA